jgi:uncharacterized integral membrane protein
MAKFASLLKWLILLPILLVVLLLAVSNDQSTAVHLNPFDTSDPVLRLDLPLYQIAFAVFALGAVCGGFVMWNTQRRYRRKSHERREQIALWQARAESSERQLGQSTALALRPERA